MKHSLRVVLAYCAVLACPALADDATKPPTTIPVYTPSNAPATPTVEQLQHVNSVTYCGVTWTFDRVAPVGRFVTGDYYVIGPVVVTGITPGWDGTKNGSTLNLPVNNVSQSGLDTRVSFDRYKSYLTHAPPINMTPGDILISSIGMADGETPTEPFGGGSTGKSPVKSTSVLHCMTAPVPPDAFRPGYTDRTQTVYLARNLNRAMLPTLNYGSTVYPWMPSLKHGIFEGKTDITIDDWALLFERPWTGEVCWFGFDAPSEYEPGYKHIAARVLSMVSLILSTNETPQKKEKLLIGVVQRGIDLWGIVRGGYQGWPGYGGHGSSRKFNIVLAGALLGDAAMASPSVSYPNCLYGEDTQTLYGSGWTGAQVVFGGHQYGKGLDYWYNPSPGEIYTAGPYEHKHPSTWDRWEFQSESYRRCCNVNAWVGYDLVIQFMGLETQWAHDAFFDFCDRWMYEDNAQTAVQLQQALLQNPDPYFHDTFTFPSWWLPPYNTHAVDQFVQEMWDKFRLTINKPTDGWTRPHQDIAWKIVTQHGPTQVTVQIAEDYVEASLAGISRLELQFTAPLDPSTVTSGAVTIVGQTHGDQAGRIAAVTLSGSDVIVVQLSQPLPDVDRYTLTVAGTVKYASGSAPSGSLVRHVAALGGDVDSSGFVTEADVTTVRGFAGRPVDAATARYDVNGSGEITSADMMDLRSRLGNQLP